MHFKKKECWACGRSFNTYNSQNLADHAEAQLNLKSLVGDLEALSATLDFKFKLNSDYIRGIETANRITKEHLGKLINRYKNVAMKELNFK